MSPALALVAVLVTLLAAAAALRVAAAVTGDGLREIGFTSPCGREILRHAQAAQAAAPGLAPCAALARGMDAAAAAGEACPLPAGDPPSAHGAYARFLANAGCAQARP
jgi:hypothetical protein